ncbi:MAG: methyl-accepting chemotaxis protein [Lachnotalea sp.]
MRNIEQELMDSLKVVLPYFKVLFEDEVSLALTDKEKFIYSSYCKELDLKTKPGDPVASGGAIREALDTGKTVIKEVPAHVYGIPFKSYAIPIKEGNSVAGVVVFGKSITKKNTLTETTKEMVSALNEISIVINQIADGVQEIASMNEALLNESNKTNEQVEQIKSVVKVVDSIASQTNLLGLNAAIEAARAGENGRGFNIVAQEIRNLSNSSSESMKKIGTVINNVTETTRSINGKIVQFNEISQSQSAALEEIAASITEIHNTSKILEDIGSKL